jgi:hypothetical protein
MRTFHQTSEKGKRPVAAPAKSDPLLDFLQRPSMTTFRQAFPYLTGRDLSFSDWLEFHRDSPPEPQSFSEWIATIHDAIDDNL